MVRERVAAQHGLRDKNGQVYRLSMPPGAQIRSNTMSEASPRVSIGLPVYNGANYVGEAIESLLNQTFTDFELIICDNASTDRTEEICRAYAQRDARIRYYRNPVNIGAAGNYNRTLELSRGEYFKWAAHDDLCLPTFLEKCVAVLDQDPTVVVAYPRTAVIDSQGRVLYYDNFKLATDAPSAAKRYATLINVNHRLHGVPEIFGLMRASALKMAVPHGAYARADSVMLVRLSLLGRFFEVPEYLFFSRRHESQSITQIPKWIREGRSRLARFLGTGPIPPTEWWDRSKVGRITFPEWRILHEYSAAISRAPLYLLERLQCRLHLALFLLHYWPKLVRDLLFALEQLIVKPKAVPATDAEPSPSAPSTAQAEQTPQAQRAQL